jgi:hypothetical protein
LSFATAQQGRCQRAEKPACAAQQYFSYALRLLLSAGGGSFLTSANPTPVLFSEIGILVVHSLRSSSQLTVPVQLADNRDPVQHDGNR